MTQPKDILEFWFGELKTDDIPSDKFSIWFAADADLDARIRDRFEADVEAAARGDLDSWKDSPKGRLAVLILLDQFTRNIYRGTPGAFGYDHLALEVALEGLANGDDQALYRIERVFMYLPLEHTEDAALQARSVELFQALLDETPEGQEGFYKEYLRHAVLHKEIIDEYGRFPHRNEILGRESTPGEQAYLDDPDRPY